MVNPLDGLSYWLRQTGDLANPRPLIEHMAYMREHGGSGTLTKKVADGLRWQATVAPGDPCADGPTTQALADDFKARGFAFVPVVNVRGVRGEAQFHAEIARRFGTLVIDLEPYEGHWDQADTSLAPVYLRELRAGAPDAYLALQADPRRFWDTAGFTIPVTAPHVNAYINQHYVGWTEQGWTNVPAEVDRFGRIKASALESNPRLEFYVTSWGFGVDRAVPFTKQIQAGIYGANVFAYAGPQRVMTDAELHAFRDAAFQFQKRKPVVDPAVARYLSEMWQWAVRDEVAARTRRAYVEAEMVRLGVPIPTEIK